MPTLTVPPVQSPLHQQMCLERHRWEGQQGGPNLSPHRKQQHQAQRRLPLQNLRSPGVKRKNQAAPTIVAVTDPENDVAAPVYAESDMDELAELPTDSEP